MRRCIVIIVCLGLVLAGLAGCGTQAGQSASQATGQEELVLTPDELAAYNGKDGMSAYIAVDGLIYDVTNVSQWKNGEHNGFSAGKDLTREIKEISPHGLSKLDLVPQVGRLADSNAKPNLMFFILLGWINFSLFVLVTSHFWLRFLNKHLFHAKSKNFLGLLKRLRNIHKPIGIALAGSVFVHGYLALGAIRPHTGLMAATALAVAAAFGAAYFFSRKKTFFTLHRWTVLVVACLIAVHLIFPNLLYTLFGV